MSCGERAEVVAGDDLVRPHHVALAACGACSQTFDLNFWRRAVRVASLDPFHLIVSLGSFEATSTSPQKYRPFPPERPKPTILLERILRESAQPGLAPRAARTGTGEESTCPRESIRAQYSLAMLRVKGAWVGSRLPDHVVIHGRMR
jgi:hypothetical protein